MDRYNDYNPTKKTKSSDNKEKINKKKKRTSEIVDFAILVDHRVKLKEKRNNSLDFARELKTL